MNGATPSAVVTPERARARRSDRVRLAARTSPLAISAAALAALMLVQFVNLYRKGFGLTFYYDEWNFVMNRRGWSAGDLLAAHNEHLSLVPVLVFKTLFVTVGLDSYWPYRVAVILVHLVCVGLVFVLARRRVGDVLALAAATLILFLGAAWQNLLWPFQVGYLISVAAGLGMLIALDRRDTTGRILACVLLAVSIASSSLGIPFAVVALVDVLLRSGGGWRTTERWRPLWVVAVPLALYALWFLKYGNLSATPGQAHGFGLVRQNGPAIPGYVAEMAAAAFGALAGLSIEFGRPLALLALAAALWWAGRRYVSPRAAALAAGLAAFWGLTALLRAQLAAAADSRYLYPAGVLILLLAAELLRGATATLRVALVAAAVVAFSAAGNYGPLKAGSLQLQDWSTHLRAELGALEVAGPTAPPGLAPDPTRAPDITADRYFAAVQQHGSPADTPAEIRLAGPQQRLAADGVLAAALGISLQPARPPNAASPLPLENATSLDVGPSEGCLLLRATGEGPAAALAVPEAGIVVDNVGDAPVDVRVRSFGDEFPTLIGSVEPGRAARLVIPARPGIDWHAQVVVPDRARVCRAQ